MTQPATDTTPARPKVVAQPETASAEPMRTRSQSPRVPGGLWAFLRTLFVGTAGLALLAVVGTLGGNAWLTANQRAEAEKPEPWADPSFTTTAVTTGGMLSRWMDNDGNLENGHSYIKGIYDIWKSKAGAKTWQQTILNPIIQKQLPQLWQIEASKELVQQAALEGNAAKLAAERLKALNEKINYNTARTRLLVYEASWYPDANGAISAKGIAQLISISAKDTRLDYDVLDKIEAQLLKYAFRKKSDTHLTRPELEGFLGSPEETALRSQLDESDFIKLQVVMHKGIKEWYKEGVQSKE